MGEIADALRRARLTTRVGQTAAHPSSAPLSSPERAGVAAPDRGRPSESRAPSAREPNPVVDEIQPVDASIATLSGPLAETCRQLAVRLRASLESRAAGSVAVVSAMQNEGKTTVICNLALALASLAGGRDVALVDLDLRKPSVAETLGLHPQVGIEDVLLGRAELDDVRISVRRPAIDVYPAALAQRDSHELLGLPRLHAIVQELESRYKTVLVDTPPVLPVPDALLILREVSTCLPIASAGSSRARHFRRMIDVLPKRQMLGALLNRAREVSYAADSYYYHPADGADAGSADGERKSR